MNVALKTRKVLRQQTPLALYNYSWAMKQMRTFKLPFELDSSTMTCARHSKINICRDEETNIQQCLD